MAKQTVKRTSTTKKKTTVTVKKKSTKGSKRCPTCGKFMK